MFFFNFHLRFWWNGSAIFYLFFFLRWNGWAIFFSSGPKKMEVETERKTFPRLSELFNRPGANVMKHFHLKNNIFLYFHLCFGEMEEPFLSIYFIRSSSVKWMSHFFFFRTKKWRLRQNEKHFRDYLNYLTDLGQIL